MYPSGRHSVGSHGNVVPGCRLLMLYPVLKRVLMTHFGRAPERLTPPIVLETFTSKFESHLFLAMYFWASLPMSSLSEPQFPHLKNGVITSWFYFEG